MAVSVVMARSVGSTTGRLRLRRLVEQDLGALVELDSDPEVMRYLSGGRATPREFIEEVVLPRFVERFPGRPWLGVWAIELLGNEAFLGSVRASTRQARPRPPRPRSAIGSAGDCLGICGYATDAAGVVLETAFTDGDTQEVEATTYEENLASQRVLEKLGMRLRRRHRLTADELAAVTTFHAAGGGVWDGDDLVYGIDRAEWLASRGPRRER